jgi:predicted branched-subunit amino acid permease/uncharacterized membrane protein
MFAASRPRKILYSAGMTTTHEFNPHVTRAGVRSGLSGAAAFVPGFIIFGAAIGSLAAQHGLSVAQILAQSLFVYAGASQMVVLQMWQNPWSWGGVVAVISVTAAINARFVLMGASLRPDLGALPQGRVYALLYFLTDASWAIGMRPAADGGRDFGALLAASVSLYLLWAVTTGLGFFFGRAHRPSRALWARSHHGAGVHDLPRPDPAARLPPLALCGGGRGGAGRPWARRGPLDDPDRGAGGRVHGRGGAGMSQDAFTWTIIAATTLVTYALRAGGYWLMGHVALTPAVRRGLEALPGSIFIATALPLAVSAGPAGMAGAAATGAAMWASGRELIALAAGLATVAGLRAMGA